MRYLGLDLGTKTLGVAISDKTKTIASILTVIHFPENNYDIALKELKKIINEYDIAKIILGNPKNMNNTTGFASTRSTNFKEKLAQEFNIPIILFDERLTTIEATNILLEANLSREKRKKVIDGVAAQILLETYMKMEDNYE